MDDLYLRLLRKDDNGFERIVFAEVIVPNTLNSWDDYHTEFSARQAAYLFMIKNFGIDVDHDEQDIGGEKLHLVESFVARKGDPDFIPGAWVVGLYVDDDALWQRVMDGELNGFSYQAVNLTYGVEIEVEDEAFRVGVTQPSMFDGHTHIFTVLLDEDGRVISGGTNQIEGHSHAIGIKVVTEEANGHRHIYNLND